MASSLLSEISTSTFSMLSNLSSFSAQAVSTIASSTISASTDPRSASPPADSVNDVEFWGKAMTSYDELSKKQPKLLAKKLGQGIPDPIRGKMWQIMCKATKDPDLEATYRALLTRTSAHEKVIQRDLSRTFPKHEHFVQGGAGQESLFNVIKAYSVYDPEVGYCQGLGFIVGALILNLPDEEAFGVLVKVMYDYGFRQIFIPTMAGLDLKLYQFDKLLEEILPNVAKHLTEQGITSSMYASQWFMTVFAYRFPLDMVFRILDVIFYEGFDAMFRFALALLRRNSDAIISLDFEHLLDFLKNGLFDIYFNNVAVLIQHAALLQIPRAKLERLATLHAQDVRSRDPDAVTVAQIRSENRRLETQLKKGEATYETLNKEHIELTRCHLETKDRLESARVEREEMRVQLEALRKLVAEERLKAEEVVKEEMDELAKKNFELTKMNAELRDRLDEAEMALAVEKKKTADSEEKRVELEKRWEDLRSTLKSG